MPLFHLLLRDNSVLAQGTQMRSFTELVSVAVLAASLSACGGSGTFQPRDVPLARIAAMWATTDLRQIYSIRTDTEWHNAWQAHEPPTTPSTVRPTIDFSKSMVVGLTLGSGSNGCYGLNIRRVVEEETRLRVEYAVSTPPVGAGCTQAIVPLTDFVVLERIDKPIAFMRAGE